MVHATRKVFLAAVAALLSADSVQVMGFAPTGGAGGTGRSNVVLDTISQMKTTMNKNQELTMDILKEISAGIKELERANTAASVNNQPTPPSTVVPQSVPQLQIPQPMVTLDELQTPTQTASDLFDLPSDDSVDNYVDFWQSPEQQQPPPPQNNIWSDTPELPVPPSQPKLPMLQPDLPLDDFGQTLQRHNKPPASELPGLMPLPPDQPFLHCDQQLEYWKQQQRQQQREKELSQPPPTFRSLSPDQLFHDNSQLWQPQPQTMNLDVNGVNHVVVGLRPDQPFDHLPPQQQSQWQIPRQSPNERKIVGLRPDQLL